MIELFPTNLAMILGGVMMTICIIWSMLLPYTYKQSFYSLLILLLGYLAITDTILVIIMFLVCLCLVIREGVENENWLKDIKEKLGNIHQ